MVVNYQKKWNPKTGTCYTQTIKIDNKTKEKYNKYLSCIKKKVDKDFAKKHCYSENDLKIKSIDYIKNGINLWRNTIIKVIQ